MVRFRQAQGSVWRAWDDSQILVGGAVTEILAVVALWISSKAFSRANA